MTPDPNIVDAKTVDALMSVLNASPYELGVPTLAQLPQASVLIPLWGSSITVTAVVQDGSYRADATLGWRLVLDLSIDASTFWLTGLPGAGGGAGKEQTMAKTKSQAVARRETASKPAKKPVAATDTPSVALQATFEYGTAPNVKQITLNTQDLSKLQPGKIQFKLDHPVDLGDLTDFLTWAGTTFKFTAPKPADWPSPFSDLATVDVTIATLVIDQANGQYKLGVTMAPKTPAKLPIIGVAIKQVGLAISQGSPG